MRAAVVLGLAVGAGLAIACAGEAAHAQGLHAGGHSGSAPSQLTGGIERGLALATTALLAGLAPFAALVWLPASRDVGAGEDAIRQFGLLSWMLLYLLAIAGVGELSVYAMRASGEPLSRELFEEALFETRVGYTWLARVGFGFLTAVAITAAVRSRRTFLWWLAVGLGSISLMTLTQLSHAAAEGRFLPFLADWIHVVAATLWTGGLLGFPVVFWSGSLDAVPAGRRVILREKAVRRFSKVATAAVVVLAATGLYAALLHVPNLPALFGTPYGRALLVKLGLLVIVLAIGGMNLLLRGRGPFDRLVFVELFLVFGIFAATGFLTSFPPPTP